VSFCDKRDSIEKKKEECHKEKVVVVVVESSSRERERRDTSGTIFDILSITSLSLFFTPS
jgi:hypothetical protein